MKLIRYTLLTSLVCFALAGSSSCKKEKITTGNIHVTVSLLQGETADLTDISIQLHSSSLFDHVLFTATGAGSAASVTANFLELNEGTYYLCAWNDKDGDLEYSTGDIVAWYPYPIELVAEDDRQVTIEAYVED